MKTKKNKYKILFVCLGNICRSPAAEGIMKEIVRQKGMSNRVLVDSAGTAGYHIGELPDPRMRSHGAQRGYKFNSLSRKFHTSDFDDFDLILAMDDNNFNNIMGQSPDLESQKKVHRMVEYSQRFAHDHIPDPYYSAADGFELVLDLLEDACDGLMKNLEENKLIDNK